MPPFAHDVPPRRRGPLVVAALAVVVVGGLAVVALTADDPPPVEDVATIGPAGPPSAVLVGVWTGPDGAALPDGEPLVVGTDAGPAACGWESAVLLHLAVPLGRPTRSPIHTYEYVRDPEGVLPSGPLRGEFDDDASLPPGAASTGFVRGEAELWTSPDTLDRAVFVVLPGRVELWPRAVPPVACREG